LAAISTQGVGLPDTDLPVSAMTPKDRAPTWKTRW
jgi:hypothetical protein